MKSVVLDAMRYVDFKAKYLVTVIILAILCTACGKEKEEQGNGKGITYYMHGNGAKNLHVEFGEHIREAQEVDYGYPYKMFHEESSIYTEKLLQVCHNVRVLITELADGNEDMVEREDTCESASSQEDTKQWPDRIYEVTADNMQGNILGYSLIRQPPNPDNMYYEWDLPYLLEESMVGKGIYISDYMCETEVFLGNLLKETNY